MGLVGGKFHEPEVVAEQWWVMGLVESELREREMAAEQQ